MRTTAVTFPINQQGNRNDKCGGSSLKAMLNGFYLAILPKTRNLGIAKQLINNLFRVVENKEYKNIMFVAV
jgi:hypothetical protein